MRLQFATMLADIRFVSPPGQARGPGGERVRQHYGPHQASHWLDDPKAPWNSHSRDPAVVRNFVHCCPFCLGHLVSGGKKGFNNLAGTCTLACALFVLYS